MQGQLPIHIAIDCAAPLPAVQFLVEEWRRTRNGEADGAACSLEECGADEYLPLYFACNPGVNRDYMCLFITRRICSFFIFYFPLIY